ncbi:MAG TPA: TonB-dependent receptor, partial [Candidatus Omnitrophica bacterium]|nr:TonB-dependent receptor [Candidatus Omnitrophota bacterium]
YIGDDKKFEWQNNFILADWNTITAGFEYEEERGFSDGRNSWDRFDRKSVDNKGYYLQDQINLGDKFFTTLGIRIDDHELFGTETTYKISSAYIISRTGTRVKANWGTGFKAPSLYQLYSSYGSPDLEPDESNSYDFGFEQSLLNNKISFGLIYFHNNFKNMVDFDMATFKYKNIGRAKTKGIETELAFKPWKDLKIGINYTYLDTENKETGKELGRRPKHQVALDINYKFLDKGNLNLSTTYVSSRWDDNANTKRLKQYAKIDLTVTYDLTKNFQIFARAENLFDKDYVQIRGYEMPKASFYAGVKASF